MNTNYYIPSRIQWNVEPNAKESERLQQVVKDAILRAIETSVNEESHIIKTNLVVPEDVSDHISSDRDHPVSGT